MSAWKAQARRFSSSPTASTVGLAAQRIILYDLVCAGSINPDYFDFRRYTTLNAYVDDLLTILDTLGVDRCASTVEINNLT
jgi:pimeloyl-ACP methyl ester carboxylesterase